MRILVIGLGKSGTTALLYAIRAAMPAPADTRLIFEPHGPVAIREDHALAKVLLNPRDELGEAFYNSFDHTILIIRDPRDLVVSKALYRIYNVPAVAKDQGKLSRYLDLLRAKERDPRSVSLCSMNRLFRELLGRSSSQDEALVALLNYAMQFHASHPDCLVYPYERMVAGDFSSVADYLALPVQAQDATVPQSLSRVVRSRRAGNWRDWFCPEDVEHYRPLLLPYMTRYGYADEWDLSPNPAILPQEASEYVQRLALEAQSA